MLPQTTVISPNGVIVPFTSVVETICKASGCIIITFAVFVQALQSVTVTVYSPALKPVAVAVVCIGVVFHE